MLLHRGERAGGGARRAGGAERAWGAAWGCSIKTWFFLTMHTDAHTGAAFALDLDLLPVDHWEEDRSSSGLDEGGNDELGVRRKNQGTTALFFFSWLLFSSLSHEEAFGHFPVRL